MRLTIELKGLPASGGIAFGPLIVLRKPRCKRMGSGSADIEKRLLQAAITAAAKDIGDIAARVNADAGDILGFQLAMLEDDTLKDASIALIEEGKTADDAWQQVLDDEIAGYACSDNDYFRGRTADIADMRDRVARHLAGEEIFKGFPAGAILAADEVAPTLFLQTDWSRGGGMLLTAGSATSHVAMLARARGVPMVVGLGEVDLDGHGEAIIDGETGAAVLSPGSGDRQRYEARVSEIKARAFTESAFLRRPAMSADGIGIQLFVNVAGVEELEHIDNASCDGIGLMRSEFLFRDGAPLPGEEEQYEAYRRFLEWAAGKPVTIRTLDAGADKPIRGLTPEGEKNPFLGRRGVRLTLARPDIFRTQLRALARAAVHGRLKVMIPMVTIADELKDAALLLDEALAELKTEGVACARPPLGIMVEVPAVAIAPELFGEAAFFSIGSNDLTQYVLACARDENSLTTLQQAGHPVLLKLIEAVAAYGAARKIPVSLCGDMASDPQYLRDLLKAGLRSLSVAPSAIGRINAALSANTIGSG
jgi:phosphotransferase system enzyme I (PtsI)